MPFAEAAFRQDGRERHAELVGVREVARRLRHTRCRSHRGRRDRDQL